MSTIAPPRKAARGNDRARRSSRPVSARLGTYVDEHGSARELVCVRAAAATMLVVDRIASGKRDARLLAHLAADEPPENARRICAMYLAEEGAGSCRSLRSEDFERALGEGASSDAVANGREHDQGISLATALADPRGAPYRLELCDGCGSISQVRWCSVTPEDGERPKPVSLRHVIGALESYEPTRTLTLAALARYAHDECVSVVALRGELQRVSLSPIVLNRGLREAVQEHLARGEVTLSEIAIRCGRVRRGARDIVSGETSWLARRIGAQPEAGRAEPTPWIHSDVLALIARGLGVSPREVEL